jgi:hypothetical protein
VNQNQTFSSAEAPRPGRIDTGVLEQFDMDLAIAARSGLSLLITAYPPVALELACEVSYRAGHAAAVTVVDCEDPDAERALAALCEDAALPGRGPAKGVVLLREVQRLTPTTQALLCAALGVEPGNRPARSVIASSSVPLYDLTRSGAFDDRLFYRLNTISIDARKADS